MNKKSFVTLRSRCWFSRNYKNLTVQQVFDKDPNYIKWVVNNLNDILFADEVKQLIHEP